MKPILRQPAHSSPTRICLVPSSPHSPRQNSKELCAYSVSVFLGGSPLGLPSPPPLSSRRLPGPPLSPFQNSRESVFCAFRTCGRCRFRGRQGLPPLARPPPPSVFPPPPLSSHRLRVPSQEFWEILPKPPPSSPALPPSSRRLPGPPTPLLPPSQNSKERVFYRFRTLWRCRLSVFGRVSLGLPPLAHPPLPPPARPCIEAQGISVEMC